MSMCAAGNHDYTKKYGVCGIITAIICFPCGLICLLYVFTSYCASTGDTVAHLFAFLARMLRSAVCVVAQRSKRDSCLARLSPHTSHYGFEREANLTDDLDSWPYIVTHSLSYFHIILVTIYKIVWTVSVIHVDGPGQQLTVTPTAVPENLYRCRTSKSSVRL